MPAGLFPAEAPEKADLALTLCPTGQALHLVPRIGVLGIGCCKSGLTGEGLDIDPLAVDNALENRVLNAVAPENFTVAEGSIGAVAGKRFDLVLANILARPLTEMAADIVRACRPGGCLVLSGLLEIQADGVAAAYRAQGLPEPRRIIDGEWAALVWDSIN